MTWKGEGLLSEFSSAFKSIIRTGYLTLLNKEGDRPWIFTSQKISRNS